MEIYLKELQELVYLDDAIISKYNEIKALEGQLIYISFDGFMYPASFAIQQKQEGIEKMAARKAMLEEQFENFDTNILHGLYEFIAEYDMGREKIPMICYLLDLINKKESLKKG